MRRTLSIVGIILILLLLVLGIAAGVIYAQSENFINQRFDYPVPEINLPEATDEILAEGRRIFITRGCGGCHSQTGEGSVMVNNPMLGTIVAVNITHGAGGLPADFGESDYLEAIMHGVGKDGRGLVIMPSQDYTQWREEEIVPLLVYLMNMRPVDSEHPQRAFGPIGRLVLITGTLPVAANSINHEATGLIELDAEVSVEYGRYLSGICAGCHGIGLSGGATGDGNGNAANLTPSDSGIGAWSEENFVNALRTGQRPDGSLIDPEKMPWPSFAPMTDIEIKALYSYLRTMAPIENEN